MTIDLWSTANASTKLNDGRATDSYIAIQFCCWIAFVVMLDAVDTAIVDSRSELSILHGFGLALVTICGVGYCYWKNGAHEFVRRFAVFALPVSVQLAVVYEAVYWGSYFMYPVFTRDLDDSAYEGIWLTLELAISLGFTLAWFARLSNLMKKVASPA